MSAFGFDPSIILQGKTATLADMLEPVRQMQAMRTQQATLADLLQRQQQEQQLRSIYSQFADNPEGLSPGLMRGGFGQQAFQAQDQNAQHAKTARDLVEAAKQHVRNQVAAVQNADQYGQLIADLGPEHLAQLGLPGQYDADKLKLYVSSGIPAEKQLELEQKDRALGLRVTDTGSGQRLGYNTETGKYDIPIGTPKPQKPAGGGVGGGVGGTGLTQEALDSAATLWHIKGEMIPAGQGKTGSFIKTAVLNRSAEMFPNDDVGTNKAAFKANATSLTEAQKQYDKVDSFERTAKKNLDLMTQLVQKIPDAGSTWANKPLRAFVASMGNEDITRFNTALNAVRPEFGKILSGNTGVGGVTEGSRHEMEALMGDNLTVKQFLAAAEVLTKDAENRKSSAQEVLQEIRDRTGGKKKKEEASGTVRVRRKSDNVTKFLSPDAAKRAVDEHPDMYELVK